MVISNTEERGTFKDNKILYYNLFSFKKHKGRKMDFKIESVAKISVSKMRNSLFKFLFLSKFLYIPFRSVWKVRSINLICSRMNHSILSSVASFRVFSFNVVLTISYTMFFHISLLFCAFDIFLRCFVCLVFLWSISLNRSTECETTFHHCYHSATLSWFLRQHR